MINSPLRLDTYFFTRIHVDACEKAAEKPAEGELSHKLDYLRHKEDPRKWMITLALRQAEDKGKCCPAYTFEIHAVGMFSVDKGYPDEKVESLVRVNGPALLYGAIRELVANLTARGPFAAVHLPTVSFIDEAKGAITTAKSSSPSSSVSSSSSPRRARCRPRGAEKE